MEQNLELMRKWLERYRDSMDYCEPFFEEGKKNYKLYKMYKEKSEKIYKHDIFVPYSFAFMEDMTAYLMLSILASPITFSISPRMRAVSYSLCMELEQLVHWALTDERSEFVFELEDLIKNVNFYNVGYLLNYPVVKDVRIANQDGTYFDGMTFDRILLDSPSSLDIFPEPSTKRLSRSKWVIKRSKEAFSNLKVLEKKGIYKNVDEAKGGFNEEDGVTKMLKEIGFATSAAYDDKTGKTEILDCMADGHVITIAGRKAIIQNTTENEIKPFLFNFPMLDCRTTGAPGEFFGLALMQTIRPGQKDINTLRSQRRDNISLILNRLFIYDILAGEIDLNTLYSAPGNVIVTTNRAALDELPVSDVTASSYKEEDALKWDLQNISGLWDYMRGATPERKETATGIIKLQQAGQSRNEYILRKVDLYILQPLCKRLLIFLREHLTKEDYAEIIGKDNLSAEFYNLDIKNFQNLFSIMPLTESIVSLKEINAQQFLQAFDRLVRIPGINTIALTKQLLEKLGQKDIKAIIPQLSMEGGEQAMLAQAQMQKQGPGPGGMAPVPQGMIPEQPRA